MVRKLYERGLYDRTISAGEQALAKYSKDPALARWVAQSYMFTGKWDRAGDILAPFHADWKMPWSARLLALSQTLGAREVEPLEQLAREAQLGETKFASEFQKSNSKALKDPVFWLVILAEGYSGEKGSDAAKFLDKAFALSPKNTFVNELLAAAAAGRSKYDDAIRHYQIALSDAGEERAKKLKDSLDAVKKAKVAKEKYDEAVRAAREKQGGGGRSALFVPTSTELSQRRLS